MLESFIGLRNRNIFFLPSMDARLGRMVTAPSATSSWLRMGEFFAPQLSEPTNKKWPVRLAFFAASSTRLIKEHRNRKSDENHICVLITKTSNFSTWHLIWKWNIFISMYRRVSLGLDYKMCIYSQQLFLGITKLPVEQFLQPIAKALFSALDEYYNILT